MERGNRILLLREMFGYFFGSMGSLPEQPTVEVNIQTVIMIEPCLRHNEIRLLSV